MWLTRISIKNPYFATVLMLLLVVLGSFAWQRLPIEEFPDIRYPVAMVSASYPGASPEVVESEISKPVEDAVNTISGVKTIRSYSFEGSSAVIVEFELTTDPASAMQDVRDRIAGVQGSFRREISTPTVSQFNANDQPILSFSLTSSQTSLRALTNWVDNTLKKRLQTVTGVGEVKRVGGVTREVRVDIDPYRLEALGLSVPDVSNAIRAANRDYPTGVVSTTGNELAVRLSGKLKTPTDFADLIITTRNGAPIRLAEVAKVADTEAEPVGVTLIDGAPAVGIDIRATRGANIVAIADGIKQKLEEIRPQMPPGTQLKITYDKSKDVRTSLTEVRNTLLEGAALTVLIVFLFLGSWRSTVITGLTLPVSLIGTLFALQALGFTLNLMTLMALSLSIGLLIDDAIVVRENIVRHANLGKGHYQAALEGTQEIGLAVLATTLVIVAVFLPVGFMGGIIGKFFHQFGLTVTVAVLISMLVSFTLDPMLSSIWHDPHHHGDKHKGPLGRMLDWFENSLDRVAAGYGRSIDWVLTHRKTTLAGALTLLLGSFMLTPIIGGEFMPKSDQGEFQLNFKTAPGSSLDYTAAKAREVEAALRELPEIRSIQSKVAGGGAFDSGKTKGILTVDAGEKTERERSLFVLMQLAREKAQRVAGIQVESVTELGQHGSGGKPVNIGIRGNNVAELEAAAQRIVAQLKTIKGVTDVDTSLSAADPALNLSVKRDVAASLGIDLAQLGETLSTLLAGNNVTTWEAPDGENYDVRLQIPKPARSSELLDVLTVAGKRGEGGSASMVPLSTLTESRSSSAPRQINRINLQREVTVSANLAGRDPATVFADVNQLVKGLQLPPGLSIAQEGEQKDMQESLGYAVQALAMGVIFIYLILAAQFRSFTLPVTIMVSLPLAFIGVFWALLAFGSTLNMFSVIGIVMLMGLAAKNGILLVDFINQARSEGMPREAAIIEAGKVRLRPIMMTSLAMIFGMLPLALGSGEGSETRAPMAHAIIGGIVSSTLLTLIVVPVVYTYLDSLRGWVRHSWARLNRQA